MEQRHLCCFLRGAQLVLRSVVITTLDLEINVRLKNSEIFGSVLFGEGGSALADGAAEVILLSFSCPLPLLRTHPPSLLVCCCFVFVEMGASTASGQLEVSLFLSEKRGGKSHFGKILVPAVLRIWRFCIVSQPLLLISIETNQDPRDPLSLTALKIMLHA
jgi:hypothetical protein